MFRQLPGFQFYRNAEAGAGGGADAAAAAAAAEGSSATSKTGGDGKTVTVGEVADANKAATSAAAKVPALGSGEDKTAAPDFKASLGDLANDPTIKDVADAKTLAQRLIDTKKLVGQKLGIPGADATPEAKAAFNEAMGVPKDAAGYDMAAPADFPDDLKKEFDAEHAKKWAGEFHKNGVPAATAKAIMAEFHKEVLAQHKAFSEGQVKVAEDKAKTDGQFDELATKAFGDKKEAKLQEARAIMEKHVPKEIRDLLDTKDNASLIAIATAITGVNKEFTGEDKALGDKSEAASGESIAQLKERARNLQKDPAYGNYFVKGKDESLRLEKEVKDIYARVAEMEATKAKK